MKCSRHEPIPSERPPTVGARLKLPVVAGRSRLLCFLRATSEQPKINY
jgi:hypothetical protein